MLFFLGATGAQAAPMLYGIDPFDNGLHQIDPANGGDIATTTITLAGKTVTGGNGLATNPLTGELYAILKLSGQSGRELVRLNPLTGVATSVGNTGDNFAGLTFDASGTLYGVTGDGASTPETLFTLSLTDASRTLVTALGNGTDGEGIAFNSADGMIYHTSGLATQIFESINLGSLAIANIPLSADTSEVFGIVYDPSQGLFLASNLDADFLSITTDGTVTNIGATSTDLRGLAFNDPSTVPEPATLALLGLAFAGVGLARRRKLN